MATQRFLDALAAVDRQAYGPQQAKPGLETAENYQPPEASDEGSRPHSSDADEAPRFNAFGSDRDGW